MVLLKGKRKLSRNSWAFFAKKRGGSTKRGPELKLRLGSKVKVIGGGFEGQKQCMPLSYRILSADPPVFVLSKNFKYILH